MDVAADCARRAMSSAARRGTCTPGMVSLLAGMTDATGTNPAGVATVDVRAAKVVVVVIVSV